MLLRRLSRRDGQSGPGAKFVFSPGPGPKTAGPAHVYCHVQSWNRTDFFHPVRSG
jgi:hypothetical protein